MRRFAGILLKYNYKCDCHVCFSIIQKAAGALSSTSLVIIKNSGPTAGVSQAVENYLSNAGPVELPELNIDENTLSITYLTGEQYEERTVILDLEK